MIPLLLSLSLSLPCMSPAQTPPWYAGRHAVLLIVEGLGGARLDDPEVRAQLGALKLEPLASAQVTGDASAGWPSSGDAEARALAWGGAAPLESAGDLRSPLLKDWPAATLAFGPKAGGLDALATWVQSPSGQQRPPVVLIAHDDRYARAVERAGMGSPEAREALLQLDRSLRVIAGWLADPKRRERMAVVLIAPGSATQQRGLLDARQVYAPLIPARHRGSTQLGRFLKAFEPMQIVHHGGVALAHVRAKTQLDGRQPALIGLGALYRSVGLSAARGQHALKQISQTQGVALVITRETQADGTSVLRLISPSGEGRVEQRSHQARYRVLQGRDPLEFTDASLLGARFHDLRIWRQQDAGLRHGIERCIEIFDFDPAAAIAVVAQSGYRFDEAGHCHDERAGAQIVLAGLMAHAHASSLRGIELMPTLLAMVGAPLDDRHRQRVRDDIIASATQRSLRRLAQRMHSLAVNALDSGHGYDSTLFDTIEMRRFGRAPAYFSKVRRDLKQIAVEHFLPEPRIQQQIGPRRSLRVVATALAARIQKSVIQYQPSQIRAFDPLLRPELMLAGFLDDPMRRAELRILESPRRRFKQQLRAAPPRQEP